MQNILIVVAVLLLLLWIIGHIISALFHLMGWLFHLIPIIVLALLVVAFVSKLMGRRG